MTEAEEKAYVLGNRAAWVRLLGECLKELGCNHPEAGKARWLLEREEIVATLRSHCGAHGDNNWPDNLHLVDVIDKHLMRHVEHYYDQTFPE